jgi:hypothetical protein
VPQLFARALIVGTLNFLCENWFPFESSVLAHVMSICHADTIMCTSLLGLHNHVHIFVQSNDDTIMCTSLFNQMISFLMTQQVITPFMAMG